MQVGDILVHKSAGRAIILVAPKDNAAYQDYILGYENGGTAYTQSLAGWTLNADQSRANFTKLLITRSHSTLLGKLGSDPELFVTDGDGVVIPAWEFLPAQQKGVMVTKRSPYGYDITVPVAPIYWDGFQAEFNTTPWNCLAGLADEVRRQLLELRTAARAYNPSAKLSTLTVIDVPRAVMMEAEDAHVALGCAPSKNAYHNPVTPDFENARDVPYRFAGCHVHFGYSGCVNATDDALEYAVRQVDRIYGILSIALLDRCEDARRRKWYGRAGEYRRPPHGVEYRVPSSATLAHPAVFHLSFDLVRFGLLAGLYHADLIDVPHDRVQHIINDYDVAGARAVMREHHVTYMAILERLYGKTFGGSPRPKAPGAVYDFIMNGARNTVAMDNIAASWHFDDSKWTDHSEGPECNIQHLAERLTGMAQTGNWR